MYKNFLLEEAYFIVSKWIIDPNIYVILIAYFLKDSSLSLCFFP